MGLSLNIFYLPTQLQEKGVYKAMGEFDIFINYIEAYMTMKMKIWNMVGNETSRMQLFWTLGHKLEIYKILLRDMGEPNSSLENPVIPLS